MPLGTICQSKFCRPVIARPAAQFLVCRQRRLANSLRADPWSHLRHLRIQPMYMFSAISSLKNEFRTAPDSLDFLGNLGRSARKGSYPSCSSSKSAKSAEQAKMCWLRSRSQSSKDLLTFPLAVHVCMEVENIPFNI
jgi:hypothetical protein